MISSRSTAEGNAQRSDEALKFGEIFFRKQDKERETICEMYHDRSTLIWNGESHRSKQTIKEFYKEQSPTETTLQALDAQIMPQMGDIIDMITIIAGGKVKQGGEIFSFSRTFLLGPNAPGSSVYLIQSYCLQMLLELFLELVSVIIALLLVIGLVCLGWLLVWKFFLARFKFVKELLSISNPSNYTNKTTNGDYPDTPNSNHPNTLRSSQMRQSNSRKIR